MTGAFPPAVFQAPPTLVSLPESSAILELLFQFIYPRQYPDVECMGDAGTFAELAGAVEKYQVYPAISVCKLRMKYVFLHNQLLDSDYC